MNNRYSRQTLVPGFGSAGQDRINQSQVLVVGAGGLGCTVAAQLAGAGVGSIHIIDHDTVDISNLHRQVLFRESDVGHSKVAVAAREIQRINSTCSVSALDQRLSTRNVAALVGEVAIVIDCADNFATSYLLSDACMNVQIPLISASVNRTFGYVGQFCAKSPSIRAVFPRLPLTQTSCETVGVTGPSVGVIASLQSQEVLKAILDDRSQLCGKLLYVDAWNYSQQIIDFNGTPEPSSARLELVGAAQVNNRHLVIDVRSDEEVLAAPNNYLKLRHIPLAGLCAAAESIDLNTPIVCVCQSGQRAISAGQQLLNMGFVDVAALVPD